MIKMPQVYDSTILKACEIQTSQAVTYKMEGKSQKGEGGSSTKFPTKAFDKVPDKGGARVDEPRV